MGDSKAGPIGRLIVRSRIPILIERPTHIISPLSRLNRIGGYSVYPHEPGNSSGCIVLWDLSHSITDIRRGQSAFVGRLNLGTFSPQNWQNLGSFGYSIPNYRILLLLREDFMALYQGCIIPYAGLDISPPDLCIFPAKVIGWGFALALWWALG